jgi:hypothetical protein
MLVKVSKDKQKPFVNPFKKDEQHIKDLQKRSKNVVDPLIGVTKIYFLETLEKTAFYSDPRNMGKTKSFDSLAKVGKRLIKVGDTFRLVKERNDETLTNASLHRDYVSSTLAIKEDGTVFRDYDFHAFLEDKEYERELNDNGSKSEFFFFDSVEQLEKEYEEFTAKKFTQQVVLRTVQHYGLDLLAEATDAGYTKINFGSCMRSGKTIISLTHAKRNNCMPVYIGKNLTSQSSAEADNNRYGIVEHMATVSINGQDEELDDSEITKIAEKAIASIDCANEVMNQNIILYIDECDDSSHTEKSRKIIKQVAKHYYEKGMLFQVIPMTGTRKERGLKILNELDFMSGKNKDLAIEYWEMQILQPEDTVQRNFITISYFQEYAEGLVNISEALKNHDEGHTSIATFVEAFLRKGSKYSTKKTDVYNAPHYFFKFCVGGKSNDGYKKRMEALVDTFNDTLSVIGNKEYLFQPIWGGVTKSSEAQKFCKGIIEKNPGKIVVFVSFGMATTSFSVSGIGTSVVFSDNALGADDVQALHRAATWHKGKEWCNMVHVTTSEGTDLMLNDVYEAELPDGGPKEKQPIFKEILNYNSLIHVDIKNGRGILPRVYTGQNVQYILDERAAKRTQTNMMVQTVLGNFLKGNTNKLRPETVAKLLRIDPKSGKIKMPKKSKTEHGDDYDPHKVKDEDDNLPKPPKKKSPGMTPSKMESIIRSFVAGVQMVPATSKLMKIDMEDFQFWDEINVDQELYEMVCADLPEFKDDLEHIFRLCDDASNLKPYLQKIT